MTQHLKTWWHLFKLPVGEDGAVPSIPIPRNGTVMREELAMDHKTGQMQLYVLVRYSVWEDEQHEALKKKLFPEREETE